ncbi:hypothetical protein Poli38472_001694 [Pythium oligandrum]|uniref:Acylamino-acid-releasing enzyme n=1 Tax=Pythium oligandrum TaxID=41045 RepID=A0A8K1FTF5_PYTOL|nr:hypothetical protein Poli38472_001694 [Pythium oligandrum]|eukprot:TMW69538.1 hypothetical protein Poli38472_001694 [Pythium oligandrum]
MSTTAPALSAAKYEELTELLTEIDGDKHYVLEGYLTIHEGDDNASVQLVNAKMDLINGAMTTYHAQWHVSGLASTQPRVMSPVVPSNWTVAITSVSPSKRFTVTFTPDTTTEGIFNVFENGELLHTFRASKTLHGTVYTGEREGGITWSHDETKIAYVAEKNVAESGVFFENINSKADKTKSDDDEKKADEKTVHLGGKYEYQDDWGEQYVGKKTGGIFIATLATGKIHEIKGIADNLTCADVLFTPNDDGLVFAGTETDNPKRLGIIYCYNRPITLYHYAFNTEDVTQEGVVTQLMLEPSDEASKTIATMRSPRFSPDGTKLVFLATRDVATHNTCSQLVLVDWATKRTTTLIDIVDEPEPNYTNNPTTAFNGLFIGSLSKKCWSSDGQWIFFGTQLGARQVWKYVNMSTKEIKSPSYVEGALVAAESVLDRVDDWFLVSLSSPVRPTSVFLVNVDLATGAYKQSPIAVVDQQGKAKYVGSWMVLPVPASVSDVPAEKKVQPAVSDVLKPHTVSLTTSTSDFEATIYVPKSPPPPEGYPVMLEVHGGPHVFSPVMYRGTFEYLMALGFALVSINYRGSTGLGIRPLESLVGRVGTQDVYDCHYGLLHVIKTCGVHLNKDKVHCSSSSHGGLVASHLIAQFPGFYRSLVALNPVINLVSQFFTGDIPDWDLAVTGITRFDGVYTTQALARQAKEKTLTPLSPEARAAILAKLWQHSSMSNDLSHATTPVLFAVGANDRRVPPSQSLELYDALKALGIKTRMMKYPDDGHALGSVPVYADFSVQWAAWLVQHN